MITVQTAVEEIISTSPYLEEALSQKTLNLSSLARQIKPRIEKRLIKNVQIGAIIMALKRLENKIKNDQIKLVELINNLEDITVKSNLLEFTFSNSHELIKKQTELLEKISDEKGIFFTLTQSIFQTTIIISASKKSDVEKIFKGETILSNINHLSAITLIFPPESVKTPGAYYFILKALAWNGINIIEVVSSFTELTIILEDSFVNQAFSALKNLTSGSVD